MRVKTWFVRTNANSKNPNFQPYSFDHPIPDCDELYIDGDKLIYTDSSGKSQSLSLRSLERYLKDAKLN